ncbi:MAG TPA: serine protease [Blastocatellia bacterium]|nr:serine protease [Blastocatellia bacterium]
MEKKPRSKGAKPKAESATSDFQDYDVLAGKEGGFEEFDVTEEPETEADVSAESLGGLAASEDDFKSLNQARDEIEQTFMGDLSQQIAATAEDGAAGLGNIVGVGIGEKVVDDTPTGQMAVKVFVKEKLYASEISSEALVPSSLGGVTTDVEVIGEINAQMFTARLRPAPGGVSVGHCNRVMAGTLGCLVTRQNQLFILSNNHVLALVNAGPIGVGNPQPGRLDGGICPQDIIARLAQFIPITFGTQCNFVDAAIARTSPNLVDRRILRPGGVRQALVAPHVNPVLNQLVQKSGRTTQYRRGIITAVNVTTNVSYAPAGGIARFCRQFIVRGTPTIFSAPGDSGSLVTTFPQNRPVGLLFAGNSQTNTTICNPISAVLAALGVNIVY